MKEMADDESGTTPPLKVAAETIGAIVFCSAVGGATAIGTSPTREDWFESLEKAVVPTAELGISVRRGRCSTR